MSEKDKCTAVVSVIRPIPIRLKDLAGVSRRDRFDIYAAILKEKGCVMTPTAVKQELEKKGMTFRFVGQDMAAMRQNPSNHSIVTYSRGQYRWKATYDKDDAIVRVKRFRDEEEGQDANVKSKGFNSVSTNADDLSLLCEVALKTPRREAKE